jgi:hypothetical protein
VQTAGLPSLTNSKPALIVRDLFCLFTAVAAASARYEHSSSRCDAPNNNSSLRSVTTRLGRYVRAVGTTDSGAVLVERPEARAVKIYSLAGMVPYWL